MLLVGKPLSRPLREAHPHRLLEIDFFQAVADFADGLIDFRHKDVFQCAGATLGAPVLVEQALQVAGQAREYGRARDELMEAFA